MMPRGARLVQRLGAAPLHLEARGCRSRVPQKLEPRLVFVRRDEASPVFRRNRTGMLGGQVFIDDEMVGKPVAGIVSAFRAVGYSPVDHAWPHGAGLVNQARMLRHAPVADDRVGRYPEAEVLVPAGIKRNKKYYKENTKNNYSE